MLRNLPHIYIISLMYLALISIEVLGQGTHIEYGEDTSRYVGKYDRIYQMVSEQKVDVNTLIKFDAVQWGQIQPSITVEQRLLKYITIEPNFTMSSLDWSRDGGFCFALNPNLELKYYFNRARRERLGKNVIGFSADYFLVGFSYTFTDDKVLFNYELGENYIDDIGMDQLTDDHYNYVSWRIMYGLQRKIGNIAYADLAFGGERHYFGTYGTSKMIPKIKIKMGFALSREQFKRFSR